MGFCGRKVAKQATTNVKNAPSQRVLEKVGFKRKESYGNRASSEGNGLMHISTGFSEENGKNPESSKSERKGKF